MTLRIYGTGKIVSDSVFIESHTLSSSPTTVISFPYTENLALGYSNSASSHAAAVAFSYANSASIAATRSKTWNDLYSGTA